MDQEIHIEFSLSNATPCLYGIQTYPICGISVDSVSSFSLAKEAMSFFLLSRAHFSSTCLLCSSYLQLTCRAPLFSSVPLPILLCYKEYLSLSLWKTTEAAPGKPSWVLIRGFPLSSSLFLQCLVQLLSKLLYCWVTDCFLVCLPFPNPLWIKTSSCFFLYSLHLCQCLTQNGQY